MMYHPANGTLDESIGEPSRPRKDSGGASARVRHSRVRQESDSLKRIVIVLCIIAGLILAAYKPARSTRTVIEKSTASKISLSSRAARLQSQP
jgi:hypothetical protein